MNRSSESAGRNSNGLIVGIFVTIIGGLVLFVIQHAVEEKAETQKAIPSLVFQSIREGDEYVDVLAKSESSRNFIIHTAWYRVKRIVKEAPPKIIRKLPQPPQPPDVLSRRVRRQQRRQERKQQKAQQFVGGHEPKVTAPIQPDDVEIIPAGPVKLDEWILLDSFEPRQVDAYSPESLRIRIVDPEHTGARYEIETAFGYGDMSTPTFLRPRSFEIDVVDD